FGLFDAFLRLGLAARRPSFGGLPLATYNVAPAGARSQAISSLRRDDSSPPGASPAAGLLLFSLRSRVRLLAPARSAGARTRNISQAVYHLPCLEIRNVSMTAMYNVETSAMISMMFRKFSTGITSPLAGLVC